MGVRGSGPHHWNALEARPVRLVLLIPPQNPSGMSLSLNVELVADQHGVGPLLGLRGFGLGSPHSRWFRSDKMLTAFPLTVFAFLGFWIATATSVWAQHLDGPDPSQIERGLEIIGVDPATPQHLDLDQALQTLNIPSVSIALIDRGEVAWARAYGEGGASTRTLYQAASLSKFVTAVAAMRLVQQGQLALDQDADEVLSSWHVPESELARGHPVTLRGLLSMTGGIGVPGYVGYEPGTVLPSLVQILDGVPPANSPPVQVEYVPGSRYAYSGGGYEIVQAIIQDVAQKPFEEALQDLVLRPAGMADSLFAQPLPNTLVSRAAKGHYAGACRKLVAFTPC